MILLFIFLAALMILVAWLAGRQKPEATSRRRAIWLLAGLAATFWLLNGFLLTSPYGQEVNSSLPAVGMLPIAIALLVLCLVWSRDIGRLWVSDRWLALILVALNLALLANYWRLDPTMFYVTLGAGLVLFAVWWLGTHLVDLAFGVLSLVCLAIMIFASGAFFYTPGLDDPTWLRPVMEALTAITSLVMILLAATQVYLSLRGREPIQPRSAAWRLGLALILVVGSSLFVFWDGVWSSAHARAYEDHLPITTSLIALVAGILLAAFLVGRRRLR